MERKRVDTRKTSPDAGSGSLKWNRKSGGKREAVKKLVKAAVEEHLDTATQAKNKQLRALQHKALPFVMGSKTVRKRVYFRWCLRRGLDPTQRENVINFANRRAWQRERSARLMRENNAKQRVA